VILAAVLLTEIIVKFTFHSRVVLRHDLTILRCKKEIIINCYESAFNWREFLRNFNWISQRVASMSTRRILPGKTVI